MANYIYPKMPSIPSTGDTIEFDYTGDVQKVSLQSLWYSKVKIECYGAQGGPDAAGGYAWGIFNLMDFPDKDKILYVIVGEHREGHRTETILDGNKTENLIADGTFGGGGADDGPYHCAGGASDVRTFYDTNITPKDTVQPLRYMKFDKGTLGIDSLNSRFIVAGGGGGWDTQGKAKGGGRQGGGFYNWDAPGGDGGLGGQGGSAGTGAREGNIDFKLGIFGCGGSSWNASGGGGGGWYGGSAGNGGGGGSSYVSGSDFCSVIHPDGIIAYDSGSNIQKEHTGNGLVRITIIEPGTHNKRYLCRRKNDNVMKYPLYPSIELAGFEKHIHMKDDTGVDLYAGLTKDRSLVSDIAVRDGNDVFFIANKHEPYYTAPREGHVKLCFGGAWSNPAKILKQDPPKTYAGTDICEIIQCQDRDGHGDASALLHLPRGNQKIRLFCQYGDERTPDMVFNVGNTRPIKITSHYLYTEEGTLDGWGGGATETTYTNQYIPIVNNYKVGVVYTIFGVEIYWGKDIEAMNATASI